MEGSSNKNNLMKVRINSSSSSNEEAFRVFDTLFPVIQSVEGMKPPVLKNLYQLLDRLTTSNAQWSVVNHHAVGRSHDDLDFELCHDGIKVTLDDITELSNILFKELDERFEQYSATFCGKSSSSSSSHLGVFDAVEVMSWLFRCGLLVLLLLEPQQNLLLEKASILFPRLKSLSSPNFIEGMGKHFFISLMPDVDDDNGTGCSTSSAHEDATAPLEVLMPYNPRLVLSCTMLEVFADMLIVHGQLRGYFKRINSIASINERLFSPHSDAGSDTMIEIETICNHFIVSFSDEQSFGNVMSCLFFINDKELRCPFSASVLGITSAVSLLLSPIMVSAPKYIQAHLVSLVSQAVNITSFRPVRELINCFLLTFEKSISLYKSFHMSSSPPDAYLPPFEFHISLETKNKVERLIAKLEDSSNLNSNHDSIFRTKLDLVSSSMRFVKDCQNVFVVSSCCQDEIMAILSLLVAKASESCHISVRPIVGTQHVYFLASLLKLMSVSLLQAIQCLRDSDGNYSKEYNIILQFIKYFRAAPCIFPVRQDFSDMMSSCSSRDMDSKMMFLHFSGLLSVCFDSGIDCLVKGCLLTVVASLHLIVLEEGGGLDALQSLLISIKESFLWSVVIFQETVVNGNDSDETNIEQQQCMVHNEKQRDAAAVVLEEEPPKECLPTQASPDPLVDKDPPTVPTEHQSMPLPFVKNCDVVWKTFESMEVFKRLQQKPHFRPLEQYKESSREGLAIAYMTTFLTVVEKVSRLQLNDPKNIITDDILETLAELETHGFDVRVVQGRVTSLLELKDTYEKHVNEVDELHNQISEHIHMKDRIEEEMRKLQSAKREEDEEMASLQATLRKNEESIRNLDHSFESMSSSPIL